MLCDVATKGFPILHASLGFQKLYGFSEPQCTEGACGSLVGADCILKDPSALAAAEREMLKMGSSQAGKSNNFVSQKGLGDKAGAANVAASFDAQLR